MTEAEIAWAAGLFEGEGTLYAKRTRDRFYAYLFVTSTDRDVIDRFAGLFDAHVYERPVESAGHHGTLPIFQAVISRSADALAVATVFEPWLGQRRLRKLNEVRAVVASNPPDRRGSGATWRVRRERYGPGGGNHKDASGRFARREKV